MNESNVLMMDMLGRALFGSDVNIPDNGDWNEVFAEAMHQAVLPLVFDSLDLSVINKIDNGIVNSCRAHTMIMYSRNMQCLCEQNVITELLEQHGILYVVLKGTSSSAHYPIPMIRPMGDIDLLVYDSDYDKAKELLKSVGYNDSDENIRNVTLTKQGVPVELHKRFSFTDDSEISPLVEKFIIDGLSQRQKCSVENVSFYELPAIPKGLVLLEHIRFHFFNGGIGLRQLCDWAVYLKNGITYDNWIALEALLRKLGYLNFAGIVTKACMDWLHMPETIAPWAVNFDEESAKVLIECICEDGNFGKKSNNNNYSIRLFQKEKKTITGFLGILIERSKVIFEPCRKRRILIPIGMLILLGKHFKLRLSGNRKSFKVVKMYSKANKRNKLYSKMKFRETDKN